MKLTLMIKLRPSKEQVKSLLETMKRFNLACVRIADLAFQEQTASKSRLQKVVYYSVRSQFGLSAQTAIRAISKVCEAYKRDLMIKPRFRPLGAVPYDQRNMSWKGSEHVSLLTLRGREIIPLVLGAYQQQRLEGLRGQAKLIFRDSSFYLAVAIERLEPAADAPNGFLGVDLGIRNIAADSDGRTYSGGQVNGLRRRHARLRAKLQKKSTKSATRRLKKRRRKEARFAADVNHTISKQLVAKAKGTGRGIALEDLQGIRERVTVRTAQRRSHHSWSFHQLRAFIEYKSRLAGVQVVIVDPRNTSRMCPACGHCNKANRPSRNQFRCVCCRFAGPADTIAAINIGRRAVV